MNILLMLLITAGVFVLAYGIYGRFMDGVFGTDDRRPTPANRFSDSRDYVAGKWPVVFSHHFSSIAGGGPIIGPAIAIVYGFFPSWLWIVIGAVFIGAVHDFTSLFVSIREDGRSIAEVTNRTLGRAGYVLFIIFALFMVVVVTAAFLGLTSTALSSLAPLDSLGLPEGSTILKTVTDPRSGLTKAKIGGVASTSVIVITFFSPLIGYLLVKKKMRVSIAGAISIAVASASIIAGLKYPVGITPELWMTIISIYVFFASGLPIWLVLQPRDFINSFILYGGLAALLIGIFIGGMGGMSIGFPAFNISAGNERLGLIWPILFITVACGAISGFHSLISSGTTSKQISKESEARRIGMGGMLLEGLLAASVLIAVGSALDFGNYMNIVFPEGQGARSNPVLAFSLGMGAIMSKSTALPAYAGTVFGILLVEGFLITTLDTAVRLNRYLLEELWRVIFKDPPAFLRSYMFNAGISVSAMYLMAYKQAFLSIWPVFGSANQLLAALALITVSAWLMKRGKKALFTALPAAFMITTTMASLVYLLWTKYIPGGNLLLSALSILLVALSTSIVLITIRQRTRS